MDADEGLFYHEEFEISYCAVNMTQGITRCCASFAIEADFLLTDLEEKSKAKQKCGFCMFSPQVFPIHRQLYIDDGIHLKDNFTEPAYFHPTSLGSTLVKMRWFCFTYIKIIIQEFSLRFLDYHWWFSKWIRKIVRESFISRDTGILTNFKNYVKV